jgi:signal transduction histidine kinase
LVSWLWKPSAEATVRDTSPGISAADQAKLFQEFQQADNTITRKKGGTGLGLAISKRIIEMHGGRIWEGVLADVDADRGDDISAGSCAWHGMLLILTAPCRLSAA